MQFWLFAVDFWIAAGLIKFDWMIEDIQSMQQIQLNKQPGINQFS